MRLVVDTSVLVGELVRQSGRRRLADVRLDLFMPEQMWGEVQAELPRRVAAFARRRGIAPQAARELVQFCLEAIQANVGVVDVAAYGALEDEARARSPRDPDDWPLIASALALDASVWTHDHDLLGSGLPTWTTQTLQRWLERHPNAVRDDS